MSECRVWDEFISKHLRKLQCDLIRVICRWDGTPVHHICLQKPCIYYYEIGKYRSARAHLKAISRLLLPPNFKEAEWKDV